VIGWLRRHPLAVALTAQAVLLFWHLSLLAPWFDEADELLFLKGPLGQAIAIPASGLHPPLYFLLVYGWMRLPLGLTWTVQARALSVLFALGATVAADRFWVRRLPEGRRWAFLSLFVLSPCLLLYSRMARSYTLQLLLATVAGGLIRDVAIKPTRARTAALAAVLGTLLYVHYVPAAAMLAATTVVLARARRWREMVAAEGCAVLAFLPWLPKLVWSLEQWGAHKQAYHLSGSGAAEVGLKVAYWSMSFLVGETLPDWLLVAGAVFGVLLAAVLARRRAPGGLPFAGLILVPAAVVGFVGVMRWVSYPFIPARMLFIFAVLLAAAVERAGRPVAGTVPSSRRFQARWLLAGLLLISVCGDWCYFHRIGFRNKEYPMPMAEIAERIRATSNPADAAVLVDSTNSDPIGLRYALGPDFPVLETAEKDARKTIATDVADPRIRTVWFLRNTHDVSSGLNEQFAAEITAAGLHKRVWPLQPYTALEKRALRAMGMTDPPAYFSELLEFRH
jgi:hypothetical protein